MTMMVTWNCGVKLLCLSSLLIGAAVTAEAEVSSDRPAGMQDRFQSRSSEESGRQGGGHWEKLAGTIQKLKSVSLVGIDQDNVLALISTGQGRRIVDLGNTQKLQDLDIQKGDSITAWGQTKRIRGTDVFMARKLEVNGDKVFVGRPELTRRDEPQGGRQVGQKGEQTGESPTQNRIRGQVIVAGEVVELDRDTFDRDLFYVVKEPSGRETELIVTKGPALNDEFNLGDKVEARVKSDGTVTSISRLSDGNSGRSTGDQTRTRSSGQINRRDTKDGLSASPSQGQSTHGAMSNDPDRQTAQSEKQDGP